MGHLQTGSRESYLASANGTLLPTRSERARKVPKGGSWHLLLPGARTGKHFDRVRPAPPDKLNATFTHFPYRKRAFGVQPVFSGLESYLLAPPHRP
jgi:hypothetical protein